jgi:hypothetical protein
MSANTGKVFFVWCQCVSIVFRQRTYFGTTMTIGKW